MTSRTTVLSLPPCTAYMHIKDPSIMLGRTRVLKPAHLTRTISLWGLISTDLRAVLSFDSGCV